MSARRKLVIFGAGDIAELAHFYFTQDSVFNVDAFTVDAAYIRSDTFCGRPVVPFEQLAQHCPPATHDLFVALSYSRLNSVRKAKYLEAKRLGYTLASYVSPRAVVLNPRGIGQNCFVQENCLVQPFATLGHNVTLWCGSTVAHHSTIGDHTFIAPSVAISGGVKVGEQCFIGINATLRDHISVGDRCVIAAGALVLSDVPPDTVVGGLESGRRRLDPTRLGPA